MNLPVLFRTIDGISQITIETQYAARDFGPFGMARAAVYVSLSSKGYEPLVCAHALFAPSVLRSARAPDDRRRTIVLYWRSNFGFA
jgi:hypothetical protein